ncbi:hypothetical protein [Streptomyces sp. NPDC093598]|uniref:hypothetical protein n=1 Tax=Streptomyces sp. NPDC093598 TaxID=3366046 RepID=UPI00381FA861
MTELSVEEIAELRKDPASFRDYLRHITGREVRSEPEPAPLAVAPDPGYRITHTGGWPLGTAATGPTPPPGQCTCAKCGGNPNSHTTHRQIGDAA